MRIMTAVVLMGLAMGAGGCNSRDVQQVHNNDKAVENNAGADKTGGARKSAPVVSVPVVNKAAGQATEVIHTAAVDVNQTATTVQAGAQQVTSDAARLTNDAAKAGNTVLNNATRDLDKLKNVLR
jgi:hypothetical protein